MLNSGRAECNRPNTLPENFKTNELLQTLNIMSTRFYHPWVGDLYSTEGYLGKRLLLLGESNYLPPGGGDGDSPTLTRACVLYSALKGGGNGFGDRVLRLVTGADGRLSPAQRLDFWHRVAFCNFIQGAMAGPRIRPTPAMWAAGREPFLETLNELAPHAVLVLGKALGSYVPPAPIGVSVYKVNHPSSRGFSRREWIPKIQAFLQAADA